MAKKSSFMLGFQPSCAVLCASMEQLSRATVQINPFRDISFSGSIAGCVINEKVERNFPKDIQKSKRRFHSSKLRRRQKLPFPSNFARSHFPELFLKVKFMHGLNQV